MFKKFHWVLKRLKAIAIRYVWNKRMKCRRIRKKFDRLTFYITSVIAKATFFIFVDFFKIIYYIIYCKLKLFYKLIKTSVYLFKNHAAGISSFLKNKVNILENLFKNHFKRLF